MKRNADQKKGINRRIVFCLCAVLLVSGIFLGFCINPRLQNPSKNTDLASLPQPSVADIAPKIYIDGMDASRDWDNCPWVNGSGTFVDPYVIHDLSINGSRSGSCIIINNTQQYFKIENCSLIYSGYEMYDAGIRLLNASNGILNNNNCSENRKSGITLSSSCKNNTISGNNCSRNYYYGIYLVWSSNNAISGNNCSENYNYGIHILYSSNNTISGNNCSRDEQGIYIDSSSNNTLNGNICAQNYRWGIDLAGASNNTLFDNQMQDNGIFVWGSVENAVTNSINISNLVNGKPVAFFANKSNIYFPADAGQVLFSYCNDTTVQDLSDSSVLITLYSSYNNTLSRNNCSGFVNGIELWESSNNTIINNTCFDNTRNGIYLYNSFNNSLSGNNCSGNQFSGISLQAHFNTLERNNCSGNLFYGIYLEVSNNCSIKNNLCRENNIGIIVDSSDYGTFDANTCQLNRYRGIYFSYSCNNTLKNNFCSANEDGIYIGFTSHNNTLNENNCSINSERGIYLSASNNNSLWGNNCSRNLGHGVYLSKSNFTDVVQNLVKKNGQGQVTEDNCSENKIHDNIIILLPTASFTASLATIMVGQSIDFTSMFTGGCSPFAYQWNFGDGTGNTTDLNPTHQFTTPGDYTITLSVTDAEGDVSVYQREVTVQPSNGSDWMYFVIIAAIAVIIVAIGWFVKKRKGKGTRNTKI